MDVTVEDLIAIVEKTPELSDVGFRHNSFFDRDLTRDQRIAKFQSGRERLKKHCFREFKLACEWLAGCQKRKTINKNFGSYGLKHYVERWATRRGIEDYYVSNGAFIAATIHLGFACEPIFDSPNAYFNISSKSPSIVEDKR